jgi:large subunit ribosomal protein L4e
MFAPTKTWRRWHRKINLNEKRYAMVSSIAASAVPALVMARGHRVEELAEVPLVVDNKVIDNIDKSSKAVALLKSLKAYDDVEKVKDSRNLRAGQGKSRNRRFRQRRGPLIVYNQENSACINAFRNLPGVEVCNVNRLSVLQLAPGGHLGRFVIWAKDAFEKLDSIYGTYTKVSQSKRDYRLPRPLMTNSDLTRLINSEEIQGQVRAPKKNVRLDRKKVNPLKNRAARATLNPAYPSQLRREHKAQEERSKKKAELVEQKRKGIAKKDPKVAAKTKALQKRLRTQHKSFLELVAK